MSASPAAEREVHRAFPARAAAGFLGLFIALDLGVFFAYARALLNPYIEWTTAVSWRLLRFVGIAATADADRIVVGNHTLIITLECTAIFIIALYASLVIAYPTDPWHKIVGLIAGVPLIVAINIARLVATGAVAAGAPGAFNFTHDYVWQVLFVLAVVFMWSVWTGRERRAA
jgi:exosortase/archaeosortase family protein